MATALGQRVGEALEQRYDKLVKLLDDALEAKKTFYATCPGCGKREAFEITDVTGAVKAAEFFRNTGFGTPGQQAKPPVVDVPKDTDTEDMGDDTLRSLLSSERSAP